MLRLIGSPDPSGRQSDGLGGATPASSKVVILAPSRRPDCDVDYQFGQVAITEPQIDWRGNCDDLAAAVGSVALSEELFDLDAVLAADPGGRQAYSSDTGWPTGCTHPGRTARHRTKTWRR